MAFLEAVLIALTCSLDAFTAGFSYGSNRIHIPWRSTHIINLICSATLGLSLWIGARIQHFLPVELSKYICFGVLSILGFTKLLDCVTKSIIKKYSQDHHHHLQRDFSFSMFNFRFILHLCANPEEADIDASKTLSAKEAAALAISLSLDGAAIGFGAALGSISILAVLIASLITDVLAVQFGCHLGNRIARAVPFNLSWISGAILILLAISKLF